MQIMCLRECLIESVVELVFNRREIRSKNGIGEEKKETTTSLESYCATFVVEK